MKTHKIIAHRGVFDNETIIENSLDSFKKAISLKYPIEFDVQLTKDNKLVVFHDDDLKRLCGRDDIVQDMDSSEVTRMKLLGTKQEIPYLKDVLELNNDKVFMDIEIKHTKRIKDTVYYLMKELEEYKNYVIISFDPRIIRYIKKNYPDVEVGLLIQGDYGNIFKNFILHRNIILKYSLCDFVSISKKIYNNKKMMKKLDKYPILLWTIKNPEDINYDDDISYVCNNLPYTNKKDL